MGNNGKGVTKGAWTREEDTLLRDCIERYGEGKWHQVPARAGLNRCRKSCRLRWLNYLRPNIKRGFFNKDEIDLIVRLHKLLGNRWSLIAGRLPGRTANDVKNFWNTNIVHKSSAAGESCRKPKTTAKDVTCKNNIIKPRPRTLTLSKSSQVPPCLSEATRTYKSNDENPNNIQPFFSASFSLEETNFWTINNGGNHKNNEPSPSLSREEVDECNIWWSSLLEVTENGEGTTPFSFPDIDGVFGSANNLADHADGFSL